MLVTADPTKAVLDRYQRFASRFQGAETSYTVHQKGVPTATAHFLFLRGKSMRLDAKWKGSDYSYVTTRSGLLRELERSTRTYDEYEKGAPYGLVPSSISATQGFVYPFFILANDIRSGYSKSPKTTYIGRSTVLGRGADVVRFEVLTQMGPVFQEFSIDDRGQIVQFAQFNGSVDRRPNARIWQFESFKGLTSVPSSRWTLAIPNGYVPYRLPDADGPMRVGSKFPFSGWTGSAGRLPGGTRALYALIGVDSPPSAKSLVALSELKRRGLKVYLLSDARSRAAAQGRYYDATGRSLGALSVTGTPTFFLVGKSGKIEHLWMGYDPEKRMDFVKEVLDSQKESATQ